MSESRDVDLSGYQLWSNRSTIENEDPLLDEHQNQKDFEFVEGDLDEERQLITINSYDEHWKEYGDVYEWHPEMRKRTREDYLDFFLRKVHPNGIIRKVYVGGCGTGRDAQFLAQRRCEVVAVDSSRNMAIATNEALTYTPGVLVKHEDIRTGNYMEDTFDGLLYESVLQHIPKDELLPVLFNAKTWLKPNGIFLFRLRVSETGQVFRTFDVVGERYFQSYTPEEIEVIKNSIAGPGDIITTKHVRHKVPDRPGFYSIAIQKEDDLESGGWS